MENKYELLKDDTDMIFVTGLCRILYRIRALRDFRDVKKGDLGGYIEKEENLSQEGECWVYDDAKVCDGAIVSDDAEIHDNAVIYRNAKVYDYAIINDNSKIYDGAQVHGNTLICNSVKVYGCADIGGNTVIRDCVRILGNTKIYNALLNGNVVIDDNAEVVDVTHINDGTKLRKDAYITNNDDYITIGPLGRRSACTTFYLTKDRNIMVSCGCFNNTIEEFVRAVKKTHRDNKKYKKEYLGIVKYVKSILI